MPFSVQHPASSVLSTGSVLSSGYCPSCPASSVLHRTQDDTQGASQNAGRALTLDARVDPRRWTRQHGGRWTLDSMLRAVPVFLFSVRKYAIQILSVTSSSLTALAGIAGSSGGRFQVMWLLAIGSLPCSFRTGV